MKYFIFAFLRSGVEAKRGVEFHYSIKLSVAMFSEFVAFECLRKKGNRVS